MGVMGVQCEITKSAQDRQTATPERPSFGGFDFRLALAGATGCDLILVSTKTRPSLARGLSNSNFRFEAGDLEFRASKSGSLAAWAQEVHAAERPGAPAAVGSSDAAAWWAAVGPGDSHSDMNLSGGG